MRRLCHATVLVALVLGCSASSEAGHPYTFTIIAQRKNLSPPLFPVSFNSLVTEPSINSSGVVAFSGLLQATFQRAVFKGDGTFLTEIANPDSVEPTRRFLTTNQAVIADGGNVVFFGVPKGTVINGIFVGNGGPVATVADGATAGFTGGTFANEPDLNDRGVAAFQFEPLFGGGRDTIQLGGVGVTPTLLYDTLTSPFLDSNAFGLAVALNNSGWVAFGAQLDARLAPGLPVKGVYKGNGSPPITIWDSTQDPNWSDPSPHVAINDSGVVAFQMLGPGRYGIFTGDGTSPLTPVATTTSGNWSFVWEYPSINNNGLVVFEGIPASGLWPRGIYHWDDPLTEADPETDRVIRFGDPLHGAQVRFLRIGSHAVNDAGQIAFYASLTDGNDVVARADPPRPPTARAGPDQTVSEGDTVVLDGSGSHSADGDPITYRWLKILGPMVDLDLTDPSRPTFEAPLVPAGGATLTFQLIVDDNGLSSEPDTVDVTVRNVNHAPVAIAGDDQSVREGSPVTLDGGQSYDTDGETRTFSWEQIGGSAVTLSDPTSAAPAFTAPPVGPAGETLRFRLTVSDGTDSSSDEVVIHVGNENNPPTANPIATPPTTDEGGTVNLYANPFDPDQDGVTCLWTQVDGPSVGSFDSTSCDTNIVAPLVTASVALTFEMVVSDGMLSSPPAPVAVFVQDVGAPPACDLAQAIPASLWPPNHKMLAVAITGVSDPDNQQVTLTVTAVTQDEPVNGLGDGDTSPDAVLQGSSVLIRSERSGLGNGRVYRINFMASDGSGDSCTGSVAVCVPHDRATDSCIDDGQVYNSLTP